MRWFLALQGVIVVVGLLMNVIGTFSGDASTLRVLDMPLACGSGFAGSEPCWIALGHSGIIVFGIGVGLVFYGAVGVGALFAAGQASAGLIAFGQVALGLVFFVAQFGIGLTGLGQVAVGGLTQGQGRLGKNGAAYLSWLNAELDDTLRPRKRR